MLVGTIFPEFTEKSIDLNEQLHIDDSIQFVILTQNDTISKTYKEMTIRHKGDLDVRLGIDIYNKNIKYTPLALEAYQNGVTILPYQGWIKYELGD